MLAIFIFFVLLYTAAADCPKGCDCLPDPVSPNSALLVCRWSPETSHNAAIRHENVRSIRISCTQDHILPDELLQQLTSLQTLRIEGCRLHEPARLLEKLENLRSLNLDQVYTNGPSLSLSEGALSPLSRLEKLSITSSGLQRLPTDIYCALKNLQVLNVSSNSLPSLKTETSCLAAQLIIADFSHNDLIKISDHLHVLPALRQLSLAYNRLTSLAPSSLETISHLQQLDLEGNQIESVEGLPDTLIHVALAYNRLSVIPSALASLTSLVSLNLSHNNLDEASPAVFVSSVLESVDFSFNRLTMMPSRLLTSSQESIVHLNLEANAVENIQPLELQKYQKLQTLNLASNRLRLLRDDVFSGLQHLSSLRLNNNSLDTIEPAVFADLAIDELDLSSNHFTEAPIAIGRLYKLKKIDLSNNKISKLYHFIFNKIPHLHTINLSYNGLESIGPYVFSDCAHLTNLDLSHNLVSLVFKDSLIKCPQLRRLDLSHNRIDSVEDVLAQASSVRRLDISSNRLRLLQWESLPARLENLQAEDNEISLLGAAYKSKVRVASLRNNRLTSLTSDQIPNSVEQVDLSSNQIKHISAGTFGAKTSLRRLNLTANALVTVAADQLEVLEGVQTVEVTLRGNPLKCACELEWIHQEKLKRRLSLVDSDVTVCIHELDGRQMALGQVKEGDLLCPYSQVCEPECVCCQFGNCDCKAVCPAGCECYRDARFEKNVVKCQALNSTQMKAFSPSDLPMSATHIFLSSLSLPILRSHSFLGRTRLQYLHINASRIQTIQPKAFNTLPALKLLDLSDNELELLSGEELHKTPLVSSLYLSGNRLKSVEKSLIDKLPELQMITLHKNDMWDVSASLDSPQIRSLSLAGNPLRCDCVADRYSAPHWIHANRQKVVDADRVLCVENVTKAFRDNDTTVLSAYPPNVGHDIFTMPVNEFLAEFNRSICVPLSHGFFGQEPQNSILVFVSLVVCALLLLALVLLVVSMARRTHGVINHRRYKASSSLNCSSSPGSSPLPLPLINFDAFISYSKKDEKMVQDLVCRRLEDEDYSLCLLHRDGPVYHHLLHSISDELISQMDASQALVLVLTRNFLENEWKTLQIKTSHQLYAKNRQKRLIVVVGNDVDQNLLDEELGQILRKNTCYRISDPLFWTLLRSALPNRISPPPSDSSQLYSDMYGCVPSAMV